MDNGHYQQLIKLRFLICPFMGDENLTSGSINLTYRRNRRNDTFIERVFEQVGISPEQLFCWCNFVCLQGHARRIGSLFLH